MASYITIHVDDMEPEEKGNGHVSAAFSVFAVVISAVKVTRHDGSIRGNASTRRSRSTPAIDSTVNEEGVVSRVSCSHQTLSAFKCSPMNIGFLQNHI